VVLLDKATAVHTPMIAKWAADDCKMSCWMGRNIFLFHSQRLWLWTPSEKNCHNMVQVALWLNDVCTVQLASWLNDVSTVQLALWLNDVCTVQLALWLNDVSTVQLGLWLNDVSYGTIGFVTERCVYSTIGFVTEWCVIVFQLTLMNCWMNNDLKASRRLKL